MILAATRRRAARLPVLWNLILESWRESVLRFLDEDLARLAAAGWRQVDLEMVREASLVLDGERRLQVHGRFDRLLRGPGETACIGDYKTGGKLAEAANPTKILKLHRLQVPLYWLLGQRTADVELLGVGPDYGPGGPREEDRLVTFRGFASPEQEQGLREGLAVLADLLRRGAFPLRPDNHCNWCDYRPACRRSHPPTLEREENAGDSRDYRDVQRRSSKRPLLDRVREEPA
jgi:RecB family exonuclease